ncbi:BLUF domain-containing protein [Sphingomonas sp.]|uniref:BLUF domain-containing protein n=1 Tax=Sphingomonas sp. TaxID=28214 RepID=UPI003B00198B
MRQIIYASTANATSAANLAPEILRGARAINGISGITGLLCATGDRFMQLLEGPEDSVASAMERIAADSRHRDIDVMIDRDIAGRAFGDWSMAYREKGLPAEALAERIAVSLVDASPEIAERFRAFIG